jgi:hypothetical protein
MTRLPLPLSSNAGDNIITATVCGVSLAPTPVSAAYTFTMPVPDLGSTTGSNDLDSDQTIGPGQAIWVSIPSSAAAFGGTLHCSAGPAPADADCTSPVCSVPLTASGAPSTFVVKAIACGASAAAQNTSAERVQTFTVH